MKRTPMFRARRLCRRLGAAQGPRSEDVAIHVDVPPGEAQVAFGYLGTLYDPDCGRERKAWMFVLVLAHSCRMVTRIVFDQASETWIRLHVEAFEELGGVPTASVPRARTSWTPTRGIYVFSGRYSSIRARRIPESSPFACSTASTNSP